MTIRILHPDGREETRPGNEQLKFADERAIVGGFVEVVWVLHQGKRTCMLVHETGAIENPPLPINTKATDIYHQASKARGKDWVGPPFVHGTVILYEGMVIT